MEILIYIVRMLEDPLDREHTSRDAPTTESVYAKIYSSLGKFEGFPDDQRVVDLGELKIREEIDLSYLEYRYSKVVNILPPREIESFAFYLQNILTEEEVLKLVELQERDRKRRPKELR